MTRIILGAFIGSMCGVCLLGGWGARDGFVHGWIWTGRSGIPPSAHAAAVSAFVYVAYFWWLAAGVGTIIGAVAGFGSWLVRPREKRALHSHGSRCESQGTRS